MTRAGGCPRGPGDSEERLGGSGEAEGIGDAGAQEPLNDRAQVRVSERLSCLPLPRCHISSYTCLPYLHHVLDNVLRERKGRGKETAEGTSAAGKEG